MGLGRAWLWRAAVAAVLLAHLAMLFHSAGKKSATSDEPFHIARGVSALFSGDFRLSVAHPPLVNLLCAAPMVFFHDLEVPFNEATWQNPEADHYLRKLKFFSLLLWVHDTPQWRGNPDPLKIIFWARVPVMIMSAALGLVICLWARKLFGPAAGLFALVLYCFSPTALAHGRLATTDTGAALFMALFFMALARGLEKPGVKALVLCGFTLGLAQLSKYTAVLIIPLTPVVLLAAAQGPWIERLKEFVVPAPKRRAFFTGLWAWLMMVVVCLFVIWAGYGFELRSIHEIQPGGPVSLSEPGVSMKRLAVDMMAAVPLPPRTYYYGLATTLMDTSAHFHPLYFLGELSEEGWWYYYPVLFLIKEPVSLLLMIVAALAALGKGPRTPRPHALVMAVFGGGILLFFMFLNEKNIGIRHLLPLYPLLFVWVARLAAVRAWRGLLPWGAWALLAVYAINALLVHPDYLVHFNRLAGGPDKGLRLSVVGEDWGQDVAGLGRFCREKGITRIHYNPYGNVDPRAYGVPRVKLRCGALEPGWYAVHLVDLLRPREGESKDCYKEFRGMEPVAVINHTIYVYRINSGRKDHAAER